MQIKTLGAAFFFGGLLLTAGAVGGMEHQPDAELWKQLVTAVVGLAWMWVGTLIIKD